MLSIFQIAEKPVDSQQALQSMQFNR